MEISYLEWDSAFFQKKIGKIDCSGIIDFSEDRLEELLIKARADDWNLLYVFCNKDRYIDNTLLQKFDGKLVDRKVIFEGEIIRNKMSVSVPTDIQEYKSEVVSDDLLKLAYISGECSRFKLDNNFDNNSFYDLYKIWIEKSVKHQNADIVYVSQSETGEVSGMVTVKLKPDCGEIGLIAVDRSTQNYGIGSKLIDRVKHYLLDNGKTMLEVATQVDNVKACNFYRKCDLVEKNTTNIYHFWLK